jgi:hypothetical protein
MVSRLWMEARRRGGSNRSICRHGHRREMERAVGPVLVVVVEEVACEIMVLHVSQGSPSLNWKTEGRI